MAHTPCPASRSRKTRLLPVTQLGDGPADAAPVAWWQRAASATEVSKRSSAGAVRRRGYGAPRRGRCAPSARSGQSDRREWGARGLQSRCRPARGRWATLTLPTHPLPSSFVAIPPPIAAPTPAGRHRPRAPNCMVVLGRRLGAEGVYSSTVGVRGGLNPLENGLRIDSSADPEF